MRRRYRRRLNNANEELYSHRLSEQPNNSGLEVTVLRQKIVLKDYGYSIVDVEYAVPVTLDEFRDAIHSGAGTHCSPATPVADWGWRRR